MKPVYSIVIPVYNRPEEVRELLTSLTKQHYRSFEVIIVEDGSDNDCRLVVEEFSERLSIRYFLKSNEGPGPARNLGFSKAVGDYFVVFDSDCLIPESYLQEVEAFRLTHKVDAWGGPDAGHPSFSSLQQAMAWTMSSWLTTGGIRGGKGALNSFQPRSFNMGLSRAVFEKTGGYRFERFAEDIELSIRMRAAGFGVWLIPEAFVYHKRRTSLGQFYRQVRNFGRGRVEVAREHPGTLRIAHWFPLAFNLGLVASITMSLVFPSIGLWMIGLYGFYLAMVLGGAALKSGSITVGLLAIPSVLVQFWGYAEGFIRGLFMIRK